MKTNAKSPEITEKAVIYARYSSTGQREESIEGQLRECYAFAEKYGITVIGEYCDHALTGRVDKRPEFQRMIRDSAKKHFNIVITWKNDRFARSRYDSIIYKYKLKQNGVRVLYARESIPDGPEGIILESVMEGFAEYYSANLSQNVKRGNYDSALKRQTLGQTVIGYRRGADKRFEIDPEKSPIVQKIFRDYAAGIPAVNIIADLNSRGFKTAQGNPFNKNSIRRILENEKYIGVYTYMDIRDEHGIPPLVDRGTFEQVQNLLKRHRRAPAAKKIDGGFLLTTKLFCGMCGEPMTGDGGTSRSGKIYSYYICNGRRKHKCDMYKPQKEIIEDAVVNALCEIINSDETIEKFVDRFMEWQAQKKESEIIPILEKELKKIDTAIENTMNVIDNGFVTESIKSHLLDLESQRLIKEKAISQARLESPILERDTIMWYLDRMKRGDKNDPNWRIRLVETFLQAAYLFDDGRLLLHLNYCGEGNKISIQLAKKVIKDGEPICSNLAPPAAPTQKARKNTAFQGFSLLFLCFLALLIARWRKNFSLEKG